MEIKSSKNFFARAAITNIIVFNVFYILSLLDNFAFSQVVLHISTKNISKKRVNHSVASLYCNSKNYLDSRIDTLRAMRQEKTKYFFGNISAGSPAFFKSKTLSNFFYKRFLQMYT